jgi:DNA-binding response OmpR family regulator
MPKILVVEDDPNLGLLLQEFLVNKGYNTDLAINGEAGFERFLSTNYDLCILDVMMPKKDGFSLAKDIRSKQNDMPIMFLTAKNMKEDTIHGLRVGADDYMTKPFDREELLLRIEAILRRYQKTKIVAKSTFYQLNNYEFNTDLQQLKYKTAHQKLTSKESALLALFCENLNQSISRSYALKMVWGDDSYCNARSMDVYITKIRKYLRQDPAVQIINLHGEGFKLVIGE